MLHPAAARWLSLVSVVERLLDRYDVLLVYFNYVDVRADKSIREKKNAIRKGLEDPSVRIYLKFLKYILPIINQKNRLFQSETPELPRLHGEILRLNRTVLDNFMQAEYIHGQHEKSGQSCFQPATFLEIRTYVHGN